MNYQISLLVFFEKVVSKNVLTECFSVYSVYPDNELIVLTICHLPSDSKEFCPYHRQKQSSWISGTFPFKSLKANKF